MKYFAVLALLLSGAAHAGAEPIQPTGQCDEQAINAAIRAQPSYAGRVDLAPGIFQICRGPDHLGGIVVRDRWNFVLAGSGNGTILRLADGSDTNVIRIMGGGGVTIRDLTCNGNRDRNDHRDFDHRFEVNCIRAGSSDDWPENVVVESVNAYQCSALCVMLFGRMPVVRNGFFGDADSDIVELLGEGGQIVNNRAVIRGTTGHVFGGDAQSGLLISGNSIVVERGGVVQQAIFRTYGGLYRTVLTSNVVRVEPGGWVEAVTDLRSYLNTANGNAFWLQPGPDNRLTKLKFNGGTILSDSIVQNAEIVMEDSSGSDAPGWGALLRDNFFSNVTVPDIHTLRHDGNVEIDRQD